MGIYLLKLLFALLLCFPYKILGFNWPSHVKCSERERQALLNFKQSVVDDFGILSTWSNHENNTDCCTWKGIQCENETGHIHMLNLHGSQTRYLSGDNISIFSLLELQNMEYLDLSFNAFAGSQIPQHMGSFKSLRYLDLSYSSFCGVLSYELGNLSKLEYLDLKFNDLDGTIPPQLGKLTRLGYLNLRYNRIHGEVPYQLGNVSQLRYLDLSRTSLSGAIPLQVGKLTRLCYLDLSYNYDIHGEVPYQLGNLSQLRYLDLSLTSLSGAIPFQVGNLPILHTLKLHTVEYLDITNTKWLSSLSSLTTLDLSFMRILASSRQWTQMIKDLIPNLRELGLAGNSLSDDNVSYWFSSHSNFSTSLSILDLSCNMLTSSTIQLLFNYTRNLQELYLSQNNIVPSSPQFLNFPSLVILDLTYNNLTSLTFQVNFNISSKLQELYLANCNLTDNSFLVIFASSSSTKKSIHSLITLGLSENILKSSAIFYLISNITTNLQSLFLNENLLEGPIPAGFGKEMNFLEFLYLQSNKLQGEIPASLGNICTLYHLTLNSNNLSGELSAFIGNFSRCNRHAFQVLDLSYNRITGMLSNLSIFPSLRELYLSNNQLIGDIIESPLTNLTTLNALDLSDNSLSIRCNSTWVPHFQLSMLGLASCKLGPRFPSWLQTQKYLQFLDISDAGIDDFVPDWFWNKLQTIRKMNMSYNSLKGRIPNLPIKLPSGTYVIMNSNQLEGDVPVFLSQAYSLDLSQNKFSDLNAFLCRKSTTTNMITLDLSNNQIMGQVPDCWQHLSSLTFLDMSNNKLSGKIPQSMHTLVNLEVLVLRNNSLTGGLPLTLKNCTNLNVLDVSENFLFGPIPSWIGESLQKLKILSIRVNQFFGSVPVHLCYLRQIHLLDLSRNKLSEGIPTCLKNLTEMKKREIKTSEIVRGQKMTITGGTDGYIYDSNVLLMWKGQEYVYLNPEILLKSIDLSSNDLTGEIPKELGYLVGLVSLNLSRNKLDGEIPSEIGNLNLLEFLDLSRNHFSGKIPYTLSYIDRLAQLDLSNNYLSGRIPWGRQLQTFDASSFEGNLGLCGQQLNKTCPGDETIKKPETQEVHDEDDNSVFYEALYMSLGLGFFIGFWSLLGSILLWRPWRNSYLIFLNRATDYILVEIEVNIANGHWWFKG
ncbi:hypothetical protein Fmac_016049 [Flemingia macrophylla]|uniref:Uncharacterized protein n=1 Tax=Flemingia macrophylla TaxID=520843 RepID=A0ABD1MGC0_9FABA